MSANGRRRSYGSRFTGGHQFPSTDHAPLSRGPVLERDAGHLERFSWELDVCELRGGRPDLYAITLRWNDLLAGHSELLTCNVRGAEAAQTTFRRARELVRAGERLTELPVPPGTPFN